MSRAQRILAVIVGLITGVLLMESYGAMVTAARAGGRAIPELWPLGTEALALAMEVSVLEAKRLGHRAVLRLSWLLLVASVALSTLLQVAVAPPTLVGYLTAGATPVWLLGSFAVLSLLSRTPAPTDPAADVEDQEPAGESKRVRPRAAYAALVAAGQPVTGARLAEAAGVSASYGRALLAEFQADPPWPPARPTGSGPARRRGSGDRDHLADLPQLRGRLRAARRPGPQARLLLAGLPAGRLPRPPAHQRRPAPRPPGLAHWSSGAAPPAPRVRAARRRPAPPPALGPAHRPARPAPTAARKRQRPAARRHRRRRPGAHPAHHRRPVAQGRRHQLPARGGRLPGEGRGPARQVRPLAAMNGSSL
jgi:hypothetical protein